MTENELSLVKAALAALSQNATFPADIAFAKRHLIDAIEAHEAYAAIEREARAAQENEAYTLLKASYGSK